MTEPRQFTHILAFHPQDRRRLPEIYAYASEAAARRAKLAWEREWISSDTAVVYRVTLAAVEEETT